MRIETGLNYIEGRMRVLYAAFEKCIAVEVLLEDEVHINSCPISPIIVEVIINLLVTPSTEVNNFPAIFEILHND